MLASGFAAGGRGGAGAGPCPKETLMSNAPLMPKATAVWLVENTALTFEQIADFCKLHPLEVKGIADGEVAAGIKGQDPVTSNQLTREEIARAERDPNHRLKLAEPKVKIAIAKVKKGPRYTPVSRRQDRPNAILWLVKNHPELKDAQIMRLVGTTKTTIAAIRERTHWNAQQLSPMDPVMLGLCTQIDLDFEVARASKDRPADAESGATLLSAEITTGPVERAPRVEDPFASMPASRQGERPDDLDVSNVFAKLKGIKQKA
jgi:hypothetical protein